MGQATKKSGTTSVSYEYRKASGSVVNYRQTGERPAGVEYQSLLLRDANGADHLLRNVYVPHSLDAYVREAGGPITVMYLAGASNGKNDQPFACIAAVITAGGATHSDIGAVYAFTRGVRAQIRLPYLRLCRDSIAACLLLIGFPILAYSAWMLFSLKIPVVTEDLARQEFRRLGLLPS